MQSNANVASLALTGLKPWTEKGNGAASQGHLLSERKGADVLPGLRLGRFKRLINEASRRKVIVVGDIMLDEFVWGCVRRISPEAPVPVVLLERESFMPGGAGNVARNVAALNVPTELFSIIGKDEAGKRLKQLLSEAKVGADGCFYSNGSVTTVKTRIIAHQQQVVRLDRERIQQPEKTAVARLMRLIESELISAAALIVGDYGKGLVTQAFLDWLKEKCEANGVWLSVDPKPTHTLDLSGVSLLTPNRKEAFELASATETIGCSDPLKDRELLKVAETLLESLQPGVLLITLGEHGMLLCQNDKPCIHIPTVAKQVFDVSGAGDTVIATFTAAISAGASAIEAAIFANCAAGVVVGKVGTATTTAQELMKNLVVSNLELNPRHGRILKPLRHASGDLTAYAGKNSFKAV